jgi:adenosylhomocysteine nucleosidase
MWQILFRNLLFRAAARAAQSAAAPDSQAPAPEEAASQDPASSPTPPCAAGIIFALGIEAGGLVDRMQGVLRHTGAGFIAREGGLAGRRIMLLESGVGPGAAARGAEALIAGHRPRWILSAGFAGALREELAFGNILMANEVVDLAGRRLQIDFGITSQALAGHPGLHVGRLLTVDRVISNPAEKRQLGQTSGAVAVDMETLAVAEICRREQIRFLSVRVITDALDEALPSDIDHLARQQTLFGRLGAVTGAIVRRPASVKDMWKLKENAIVASDRLARFLAGVVPQLN